MPYSNISQLPDSVKKLPVEAQKLFLSAFNKAYKKHDETVSFKIAWGVVKNRFKKVDGNWVSKGLGFTLYTFETTSNSEVFVKKGDDGEHYLEAILSDTMYDSEGKRFTEDTLKNFEKQINTYGIGGFITHADWKNFLMSYSHLSEDELVSKGRSLRKGIIRNVKAIYDKGKLWVKALLDKRYLNQVKKFNKVSLEAVIPKRFQKGDEYLGGHILGFALDNRAVNPRARIAR